MRYGLCEHCVNVDYAFILNGPSSVEVCLLPLSTLTLPHPTLLTKKTDTTTQKCDDYGEVKLVW
jgi:hypothetical protein